MAGGGITGDAGVNAAAAGVWQCEPNEVFQCRLFTLGAAGLLETLLPVNNNLCRQKGVFLVVHVEFL
jgi:hypothetical protein